MSRATVYRWFPGGRDQLLDETIAYRVDQFFLRLRDEVADAETFTDVVTRALRSAHRWIAEDEVLERLLASEPARLVPSIADETRRIVPAIAAFLEPYLQRESVVPAGPAGDYVARMVVSHIGSPGRWDLDDPDQVAELVRTEILAGVVPD